MPPKKVPTKESPPSLSQLKKQRAQSDSTAAWARLGLGGAAVLVAILIAVLTRQPNLEDHAQYQEAQRILRNDGLEANDKNLRLALRMIDVATQPYNEDKFQVIDPRRWVRGDR